MNREPLTPNPDPFPYEGGTFKGRMCRLRPEEAAPSQAGGAAFVKHPLLDAFYSDASYLSKFTEFGE